MAGGKDPIEGLREAARDLKSGASELFVNVLENLIAAASAHIDREIVERELLRVVSSHPEMVPLRNLLIVFRNLPEWPTRAEEPLIKLRNLAVNSRLKAAQTAASAIRDAESVMTLSRSSTVLSALEMAVSRGRLSRVLVAHSLPLGEGAQTAARLASRGIRVGLIPDSCVGRFVSEVDAILVGADAVLADGSLVNKVGTLHAALAAREAGIPLFSATDLLKVDLSGEGVKLATASCEGLPEPSEGVELRCSLFDLTPAHLVTAYACDVGIVEPGNIVSKARGLLSSILEP